MQELIVAIVVAGACGFTLRRYLPSSFKASIAARAAGLCLRLGWLALERRLRASTRRTAVTRCGSCRDCAQGAGPVQASITPQALKDTIRR